MGFSMGAYYMSISWFKKWGREESLRVLVLVNFWAQHFRCKRNWWKWVTWLMNSDFFRAYGIFDGRVQEVGGFFHYDGSLAIPPSSESVNGFVLHGNLSVSHRQLDTFRILLGDRISSCSMAARATELHTEASLVKATFHMRKMRLWSYGIFKGSLLHVDLLVQKMGS